VLRILAIASLISAMVSNLGVPIMALGHYRYNFVIHAVGAAVLVPLLIAGVYYHGPVGAAMAMLIANAVTAATAMILAGRVMDYGLWRFLLCVWRPVLAAILMYAVVVWTAAQIDSIAPQLPSALLLAIVVCAGALVYPLALGLLWLLCGRPDGAERTAMSLLRKVLQRVPGLASRIP
jgi:O-antigen/teichoic acid export membrane protein